MATTSCRAAVAHRRPAQRCDAAPAGRSRRPSGRSDDALGRRRLARAAIRQAGPEEGGEAQLNARSAKARAAPRARSAVSSRAARPRRPRSPAAPDRRRPTGAPPCRRGRSRRPPEQLQSLAGDVHREGRGTAQALTSVVTQIRHGGGSTRRVAFDYIVARRAQPITLRLTFARRPAVRCANTPLTAIVPQAVVAGSSTAKRNGAEEMAAAATPACGADNKRAWQS